MPCKKGTKAKLLGLTETERADLKEVVRRGLAKNEAAAIHYALGLIPGALKAKA